MSKYGPEKTPYLDTFHTVIEIKVTSVWYGDIMFIGGNARP